MYEKVQEHVFVQHEQLQKNNNNKNYYATCAIIKNKIY